MRLDSIPPGKRSILVVEDERIVARDLQLSLTELGYRVPLTVASSDDAIRAASDSCPDLVLMDIRIKGDVDGIDTAHVLRTRFGVPVVYLTAYADNETLARAKRTEPYGYLLKPIKLEELRSSVEIALYKHTMDRRLRERERWFSTTLRSIGDAVISTDAASLVTFMNPVAEKLTGWRSDEAVGRSLSEVVRLFDEHGHVEIEDPVKQAMREGGVIRVDGSLRTKSGDARMVVDSAAPIVDDLGGLVGAVVVLQDVSDQRRMQQQVELADRLTSLGTLAAGVAHEINNPLAAVMTNVQLVLADVDNVVARLGALRSDLDLRALLTETLDGAQRIKEIVADMLAFSRPTSRSRDWVDVKPVVEWAARMTAHELASRAQVVIDVSERHVVAADETRLGQVLVNLMINAAHAIEAGRPHDNTVRVSSSIENERVVIEVSDTGCGMPPEVLQRMFDPFFTTKDVGRGMGLGLAICHGIVKSWGGTIDAESIVGKGTKFRVNLPTAAASAGVSMEPPMMTESVEPASILVIDDEPLVRKVLRRSLADAHRVTVAESGHEALAAIRAGTRYDVILCDLMMPEVTGMDIYEEILRIDPEQARRIVIMTGGTYTTRSDDFLRTVENPCLVKPFGPQSLTGCINDCMNAWGPYAPVES